VAPSLARGRERTWKFEESHPQAVVLLRLLGKSEEDEEDDCTKNGSPSSDLNRVDADWVGYRDSWDLVDTRVSPVDVSPGDPWVDLLPHTVKDDTRKGDRDGDTIVDGSQSDETPVAAVSHVCVGSDEIPELLSPPHEGTDGEYWR